MGVRPAVQGDAFLIVLAEASLRCHSSVFDGASQAEKRQRFPRQSPARETKGAASMEPCSNGDDVDDDDDDNPHGSEVERNTNI